MTAPSLLDELEAVVRLTDKATPGAWSLWGTPTPSQAIQSPDKLVMQTLGGNDVPNAEAVAAAMNFIRTHHAEIAGMANELRVARESFKRCDEICKCTAEGWRTAEEDMAKRLEAAERDAARYRWLRGGDSRLAVCDEDTSYYLEQLDAIVDAAPQEGEG